MEDYFAMLERHEQSIKILERDVESLRDVQKEIHAMNETLVAFATELKHTNEHIEKHERKIEEFESQPKMKMQQIFTGVTSALAGGFISMLITFIVG